MEFKGKKTLKLIIFRILWLLIGIWFLAGVITSIALLVLVLLVLYNVQGIFSIYFFGILALTPTIMVLTFISYRGFQWFGNLIEEI